MNRLEFETELLNDDVVEIYLTKTKEELDSTLGEKVSRMVGYEQHNAHHCYDLWEHSLRTVEGIKRLDLSDEDFTLLRVAAFFHDIAKPDVSSINERTGEQVFYGHAMKSVDVARPILAKLGYSAEEIGKISFFIGHHDDFISYKTQLLSYMKNHKFIRKINNITVAEKMFENKFNFDAMEYNQDEVITICYYLANNKFPIFKIKGEYTELSLNIDEVKQKLISGRYNQYFEPTLHDYKLLLILCKADNNAQSEVAVQNGKVVATKKEKIENLNNVDKCLEAAYQLVDKKLKIFK